MFSLLESFDRRTFLRQKSKREVAGVVDGGRRKVDLFTGLRLFAADLKFIEACRWNIDAVDHERTFVSLDEVDSYLRLSKNFFVVRRRHVLDLVGKVQRVTPGGGRIESENDENEAHGNPKAGKKCRLVDFFPCFHVLILTGWGGKCPTGD